MRKKSLALVALLCLKNIGFASTFVDIEGKYDCAGTEIDQVGFTCEMQVKKTGETYAFKVDCNDGSNYISTGIYQPDKQQLSIVSINPKNKTETGVAAVEIKPDGSMESVFTYLHKTTLGHTHCHKQN